MLALAAAHTAAAALNAPHVDVWPGFGASQRSTFVRGYWQKQPLLIRGMLAAGGGCRLSRDGLVELACDPGASALIRERGDRRPWECRTAP